jgi:predicted mannosyl-3-phosphoglycerate phosphatase (HAD superfamily)
VFFDLDPTHMLPPYRRPNSGDPQFLGMSDDNDRIQIMVNFNNDASEYWQTLDVGLCSINESGTAVQLGINYVVYAMTH